MRKYSFDDHPEHEARLVEWRDKWIATALRTEPQTDEDRERCRIAMRGMYGAAKLAPPQREVFCAGPISGAIAAVLASCVWWLREHPERHVALFGRQLTEADMMAAIPVAAARAVNAAMRPARAATDAATDDATRAATDDATRAATDDATRISTDDAIDDATDAATFAATRAATRAATDAATYTATRTATVVATDDATRAATDDATRAATADAPDAAIDDATDAATRAATLAATAAATDVATDGWARRLAMQIGGPIELMLACVNSWASCYQGGNMWAAWACYLAAARDVLGLRLPQHEAYAAWEQAARHGGFRFMHAEFCLVSDFPAILRVDAQHRPHCADGPSHRWRDGWSLYHWHGVAVPREWIEERDGVDVRAVLADRNVERRRAGMEIVGWNKALAALHATTVDADPNPEIGTLLRCDLPDAPGSLFLRVRCGTGREFVLPVPEDVKTAAEANAWTYGLTSSQLRTYQVRS